jgi:hypothetical protein
VQDRPPDWQDFVGIMTLLVINSTISFIEENNAGNAAASLMARLAPKTKVSNIIYISGDHPCLKGNFASIWTFRNLTACCHDLISAVDNQVKLPFLKTLMGMIMWYCFCEAFWLFSFHCG